MKNFRKNWEANFLRSEFIAALVVAVVFALYSEFIDHAQFINCAFSDNRDVFYGTLAAIFGTLLGFSITAVSIVIGYAESEKLAIVREGKHYQDLWNVFKSSMRVLGVATLLSLLGLIFDKNSQPNNIWIYLNSFIVLLSFARIARSIWVLENIISIVTKP